MTESVEVVMLYVKLVDNTTRPIIPTITDPISGKNSTTQIFLGISIYDYHPPKAQWQSIWFPYYWNLQVLYTLNICIMSVFINILPLILTDGDKILHAYLRNKVQDDKKHKRILNGARIFSIVLIVVNIVLSMI